MMHKMHLFLFIIFALELTEGSFSSFPFISTAVLFVSFLLDF